MNEQDNNHAGSIFDLTGGAPGGMSLGSEGDDAAFFASIPNADPQAGIPGTPPPAQQTPSFPAAPVAGATTVSPFAPAAPMTPVTPVAPAAPVTPVVPSSPVAPAAPVAYTAPAAAPAPTTIQFPTPAQADQPLQGAVQNGQHETPPPAQPPVDDSQLLLAAMGAVEEQNGKQAMVPVLAQPPVFSYNGVSEDITDVNQTFDQLREAEVDDFPEFDEAKNVSWSVTYGKISKNVTNPKKTNIGEFKREIEGSKEFVEALKKSKDKNLKCILKPRVAMEKKGIASYKGVFTSMADARSSDKSICIVPAKDGKVYEMRRTGAGEFVTPTDNVVFLDEIKAGFTPALPPIPYVLFEQVVSMFRLFMFRRSEGGPCEALAQIYWDRQAQHYFIHVPTQEVSKAQIVAHLDNEALWDTDRYLHYADIHSHNSMEARFSAIDDADERANRVYIVVGRLDRYYPEISVRVCNGGKYLPIAPETVLEPRPTSEVPQSWLKNITVFDAFSRSGGQCRKGGVAA